LSDTDICPQLFQLGRAVRDDAPWVANVIASEIGGGRVTATDLEQLHATPDATAAAVSGLDQATFEHFVTEHAHRYSQIRLWKCPRVTDLTPLEDLAGLEVLDVYWNQRATRLWDLSRTTRLRALALSDIRHLHDLSALADGTALTEMHLGDAINDVSTYDTLEPLSGLVGIQRLWLVPKAITDGRIQPLGGLTGLLALRCSMRLFTTEQFAWLRAHLGDHVRSDALDGVIRTPTSLGEHDVMVTGKRKPFLNSTTQAERVAKYEAAYAHLVATFRANPDLEP
jgi:hypothetical protein